MGPALLHAVDNTGAVPYPLALVITLAVEVPIYVGVLRAVGPLRGRPALVAAIGVNLLSHPLVWVLLTARPTWFWAVEAGAWLVEAATLWALTWRRDGDWLPSLRRDGAVLALAALVANAASVLVGAGLAGLTG